MSIDAINTAKTEEEVREKVEEVRKKVSNNQGQVVLSLREIVTEVNEHHFGRPFNFEHLETGVISGGLDNLELDAYGAQEISVGPVIFDSRHPSQDYIYLPKWAIPIDKKLVTDGLLWGLNFLPETLKQATKGEIMFARQEFERTKEIWGYKRAPPYLDEFYLLIGDNETTEFLKERALPNKIDDFLKLMKTPGEIERRIEEHDFKQRENLTRDLVQSVARLTTLMDCVGTVEDRVLEASYYLSSVEQDGSHYYAWTNQEEVDKYERLRGQIVPVLKSIREYLRSADGLGLGNYAIDLKHVGIPSQVKGTDYLTNTASLLVSVEEQLKKLDTHLREGRGRKKD